MASTINNDGAFSPPSSLIVLRANSGGNPISHNQVDGNFENLRVGHNALLDELATKANATHNHSSATQSVSGFMSTSDKAKLDGIATNANNYSLPSATSSTRGGIRVGGNLSISSDVLSVNTATSSVPGVVKFDNSTIKLNSSNQLYVAKEDNHQYLTNNPHNVTASQIGLGSAASDIATLDSRLDSLESSTSTSISSLQSQVDSNASKIASNNTSISSRVSSTETSINSINNDITSLESSVSSAQSQINSLDNSVDSLLAGGGAKGPGWVFLGTPKQMYMGTRYGTFVEDVHLFGRSDPSIPSDARYVMLAHEHNQGWIQVYTAGRWGNSAYLTYGAGGDNVDGGSIFIVENLQLPADHLRLASRAGRGSPTKPTSKTTNLIPEGRVRFQFGTSDDDGSGSDHYLFILAYSY